MGIVDDETAVVIEDDKGSVAGCGGFEVSVDGTVGADVTGATVRRGGRNVRPGPARNGGIVNEGTLGSDAGKAVGVTNDVKSQPHATLGFPWQVQTPGTQKLPAPAV